MEDTKLTAEWIVDEDTEIQQLRASRLAFSVLKLRPPCDGCAFEPHCIQMRMICRGFLRWIESGKAEREDRPYPVPHNGFLDFDDENDAGPGMYVKWKYHKTGLKRSIEKITPKRGSKARKESK